MFDIGWTEMLILGVVVLLVLGPAEIPNIMFTVGKYARQMKNIASEFKSSLETMDVRSDLKDVVEWKPDVSSKQIDAVNETPKAHSSKTKAKKAEAPTQTDNIAKTELVEDNDLFAAAEPQDKR